MKQQQRNLKALEDIGVKIAKEALDYATYAGRKTIKAEDIEIATRKVTGKLCFDYYLKESDIST